MSARALPLFIGTVYRAAYAQHTTPHCPRPPTLSASVADDEGWADGSPLCVTSPSCTRSGSSPDTLDRSPHHAAGDMHATLAAKV